MYNYEVEAIPELVKNLRERDIDKDLIRKVFNENLETLRDKDALKLHYYEFIEYCISGNVNEAKYFIRNHEPYSVS